MRVSGFRAALSPDTEAEVLTSIYHALQKIRSVFDHEVEEVPST